jgi:hypothetical protein
MNNSAEHCQYYYADLATQTLPDTRVALPLRKYWWRLKTLVWYVAILGPHGFVEKILPTTRLGRLLFKDHKKNPSSFGDRGGSLGLNVGDWVEVRSAKEIFATLDQHGKFKGLSFTPEMMKFSGRRFKVYKKLQNIILEATGELRRIRAPTVLLEGVFCDGEAHGKCDRSCFCFWREAWLRKIDSDSSP